MKKKTWLIIAAVLIIVAGGVFTLLHLTGGSHTAIDRDPEPEVSGNSNVLVAYFSWSGNGQQMADWIAEETGGDLFRILTEEPYAGGLQPVLEHGLRRLRRRSSAGC